MLNPSLRLVEVVNVRLSEADYQRLVSAATKAGARTVSEWVRAVVTKAAKEKRHE